MAFSQGVKPSPSNKNYAIEVSAFKCGENEEKGSVTFVIGSGDIHFENCNITNNKCKECSSMFIVLLGCSGSYNFSTFRENNQTSSQSFCFGTWNPSLNNTFSYCNVIGNKCGIDRQILFACSCNTTIYHCIFKDNIATYMFYVEYQGSTLIISDTYVESNSTTGYDIIFNNIKEYNSFNTFIHLFDANCSINSEKNITFYISFLSKFAKTASAGLVPSKK